MGLSDFFYIYFSAPVGTRKTLHIDEEYDADADKIVFISAQPDSQELLLCMTGGVLYIICGSSLVKFSSLIPAFF